MRLLFMEFMKRSVYVSKISIKPHTEHFIGITNENTKFPFKIYIFSCFVWMNYFHVSCFKCLRFLKCWQSIRYFCKPYQNEVFAIFPLLAPIFTPLIRFVCCRILTCRSGLPAIIYLNVPRFILLGCQWNVQAVLSFQRIANDLIELNPSRGQKIIEIIERNDWHSLKLFFCWKVQPKQTSFKSLLFYLKISLAEMYFHIPTKLMMADGWLWWRCSNNRSHFIFHNDILT